MSEIGTHDNEHDCWVAYEGKAYDITDWIPLHPGGKKILIQFAGLDITDEFNSFHATNTSLKIYLKGPIIDYKAPSSLQNDFRALGKEFQEKGYFQHDYYSYKKAFLKKLSLWVLAVLCVVSSSDSRVHLVGAVFLGLFWQQVAFLGHDFGHVPKFRTEGFWLGNIVGPLFTGITMSWWKATHYIHHSVPNSVMDDPDIAHLPFLAVKPAFFSSLYNTYHERHMNFNWIAQYIFIPFQHYWYYIIMAVSRVNLYVQSIQHLQNDSCETVFEAGFFIWYIFLLTQLSSISMVCAFHFLSHAVAGILQVQITLSHFSRPVNNGREDSFGGDFYSRNIASSLDIKCSKNMDWFHGGLQFQTLHHVYPRLARQYLRLAQEPVMNLCKKHNLPYSELGFLDANIEVFNSLKDTAIKSRAFSNSIWKGMNAEG